MDYKNNFLHYFRKISDNIEKSGNAKLKDLGLTLAQGQVLGYLLDKKDNTATYKDVESILEVAQSSAASMISRLESRGFVRTYLDINDKRIKLLELTQSGKYCINSSRECIEELKKELFGKLSDEELETLMTLLQKITY
ncbi:MAG: MarR family transcriptional regulator [bacterium]